jgi:HPr kinase/phosphorylase
MIYSSWKSYSEEPDRLLLHGTAVAIGNSGLLILGPSGSGKSHLALEMIALGASLVSDDRVWLNKTGEALQLEAPEQIKGYIEAPGLGILASEPKTPVPLSYCLDLSVENKMRLPFVSEEKKLGLPVSILPGKPLAPHAAALIVLLKNGFASYDK